MENQSIAVVCAVLFTPHLLFLTLLQVYSVRVRVDSDRVLSMLLEKAQFDVARSYATIVGSTTNEVTVKEVSRVQSDFYTLLRM